MMANLHRATPFYQLLRKNNSTGEPGPVNHSVVKVSGGKIFYF